ncbi:MAG: hypothetical protein IPK10_05550 [Bacteroidetes bacterium]|nr:hypothetical protein [Bacteroidota bacterium]
MLYGEGLKTKIWNPTALGTGGKYTGNYVNYDPSQHGDIQNVNSASATIGASLNSADGAIFQGGILQNMKIEDGIAQYEQRIKSLVLGDKRFGKEAFAFDMPEELIYFGGTPNTYLPMSIQAITFVASPVLSVGLFPNTWEMALTPETWAIGRNVIRARVEVTAAGIMGVTFRVEGALDLSTGSDKSLLYNGIVTPLNIMWQGIGGSEYLPTYGAWHKKYKKK